MFYPKKLHANVLLFDGKIINWKVGTTCWNDDAWIMYRQPAIVCKHYLHPERFSADVFTMAVFNDNQRNYFFRTVAEEFMRMYDIHEQYSSNMFLPY